MSRARLAAAASLALLFSPRPVPADPPQGDAERGFTDTVRPFVQQYCVSCHGGAQPAAQFDLRKYTGARAVVEDIDHWSLVMKRLNDASMPPKGVKQPDAVTRRKVAEWIASVRLQEARRNAGDPGVVLARRLSNSEYNYTIRDLTGVDIRPAREFPVDPANAAGFDNSGESLSMSPALLNKYLQAAREVANHMVLKPGGIAFAPHPALAETDRDKYCVNQIVDFYRGQNTDYADYFVAAWRYKHRAALGKPQASIAAIAAENKVSPKYLTTIWRTLEETKEDAGPLAKLQTMWRELPAPKAAELDLARPGSERMRNWVLQLRAKIERRVPDLTVQGIGRTAQPFLMWRNRQYAANRLDYDRGALQVEGEALAAPTRPANLPSGIDDGSIPASPPPKRHPPDADLRVPAGQRAAYEAAFARFSAVFPDAFYIPERGRYFPDNTRDKGRYLSAGFHNLMGYFRDDRPLYEMVLDAQQQKQLDEYWRELDFIAEANIRTYVQFYLFETREAAKGPEGGAPIPDQEITAEPRIRKVAESYLTRAKASGNPAAVRAIEEHFKWINDGIRWVESARVQSEPVHVKALQDFAARAYRRPLSQAERDDLLAYYRTLRTRDGLSHEDAMRDSIVGVLMAPEFCYRVNLTVAAAKPERPAVAALNGYSLASRLSYFLWSSMPDERLLARAASGELNRPEVVTAEARRMLQDARARGMAVEFGTNWLDIRRFEEHNAVDRERFPSFTNELRMAMFEEPVRYFLDVAQNDRSILDFVFGNHTFVNGALAKHYGMTVQPRRGEWVRVDDARPYGRGSLLAMAAFLTKNAPGLRTSPVKRGYWVAKRVLGEEIPPPPAVVPELPRDEAKMELPLRETLARHREDASCAGCHMRFDGFGLAFESYGPVGERRTKDLAGRGVDARAQFPGGAEGEGLDGVRAHIRERRQNDFVENLCRKLLVYALGRGLMLSDEPLVDEMRSAAVANGYRFQTLIDKIVASPQFLNARRPERAAPRKGE
jgi:mono/diheme cytochrome c family protein